MISTFSNATFGESRPLSSLLDQLSTERKFDDLRTYSGLKLDGQCRFLDGGASLTKSAMNGLAGLVGLPSTMVGWLQENGYHGDLATYINNLLTERDLDDQISSRPSKRILTRFRECADGRETICRALFSDRFDAALDCFNIVGMIYDSLSMEEREQAVVTSLKYDGDELLCNLVWPGCERFVGGESFLVGIAIQNAEIGTLRLQIRPWIGRLVCSNGYLVNSPIAEGVSKRHVGRIDLNKLETSIRSTVGSALAFADRSLLQLDSARQVRLENANRVIVALGRENRLSIDQIKRWKRGHEQTLREETTGGVSAFSVVNGLTRSVQECEVSPSERVQLEALAGRLIAPKLEATIAEIEAEWRKTELKASMLSDEVMSTYIS